MASKKAAALAAVPDGVPFDQWIEREGCSRSSAYKWAGELGIKPTQEPDPGDPRKRRAWISGEQAEQLSAYAKQRKGRRIGEAIAATRGALATVPPPGWVSSAEPADTADREDDGDREALEVLGLRLQALRDAVELGVPLSTHEVRLLLGARPGGDRVTRAGIEARREARGLWRLSKASERRERW
ncbi:hypothetical protein KBZ20_16400 [Vulcanococcus limneticus Candia 3F8]|uniref:hypothetical protein n=1 Tax=Vulcanococcus limneticus TaxID=2170428 RepID=UPI0020CF2B68|nr:hypothetical protein [Vulcanococcus limneticus]MCP9793330.1 hypothetical protein [Vulcanococcus limneticus MW73D5]MCP9895348.1 hypothetical protein [Vulcanococcus limneticus Candia 3F8]MCP9898728.1 hypothetical protein [Vulcanococcus limneticus Candia 3B3]